MRWRKTLSARDVDAVDDLLVALDQHDLEPEPNAAFVRQLEDTLMTATRRTRPSFNVSSARSPLPTIGRLPQPEYRDPTRRGPRPWTSTRPTWLTGMMLLVLIVASVLVAVLVVPGSGDDDPVQLGAQESASPTVGDQISDEIRPTAQACVVEPRTLDEVVMLLQWNATSSNGRAMAPTAPPDAVPNRFALDVEWILPDGPAPDQADIDGIVETYGEMWSCNFDLDPLRVLALQSDTGLIREFYPEGVPAIGRIAYLGVPRDKQVLENTPELGDPVPTILYGFRVLPDGRIGAYTTRGSEIPAVGHTTRLNSGEGYIVFVKVGDRWLRDEGLSSAG